MKSLNKIITLISILILSTSLISCSDDNDTDVTKPIINLIDPAEGEMVQIGKDIHFEMELSDDVMLGSYKVEIHNNFNNHGHTKSDDTNTPFSFSRSWDLSGQKNAYIHHHDIVIPDNATPGNYHLMVFCTDEASNESYIARNIVLTEDEINEHEH